MDRRRRRSSCLRRSRRRNILGRMPPMMLFTFLLTMTMIRGGDSLEMKSCREALGMETREIPDEAISASSSLDDLSLGPNSGRIRTETSGGAWCPRNDVSTDTYEYLQIDLGQLKVITLVETQGRFGNGQGQEYVEQYQLNYRRQDNGQWMKFRNRRGQEFFQGNSNTHVAELREVDPPIIATSLRFVPFSLQTKDVCLRVEVYGCTSKDGVVWYSMRQGEKRSADIDLRDLTYDGVIDDGQLSGGLGQLVDGEEGQSNFRLDRRTLGIKGYEWIGWRNDSFPSSTGYVEILFRFDSLRNFTSLRIHSNNMFGKEVRVFRLARIEFSEANRFDGGSRVVEYEYMRDMLIEYARPVVIPLYDGYVGRYIRLQLHFDSRWMMISEVEFESEYVVLESLLSPVDHPLISSLPSPEDGDTPVENDDPPGGGGKGSSGSDGRVVEVISGGGGGSSQTNTRDRTRDTEETEEGKEDAVAEERDAAVASTVATEVDDDDDVMERKVSDEYIGIIVGSLLTVLFLVFAAPFILWMRHRRRCKYTTSTSSSNHHRIMKCVDLPPPPPLQHHLDVPCTSSSSSIPPNPNRTLTTTGGATHSISSSIRGCRGYNFMTTNPSDVDSDHPMICCSSSASSSAMYHNDIFTTDHHHPPPHPPSSSAASSAANRCRQLPQPPPLPLLNVISDSSSSASDALIVRQYATVDLTTLTVPPPPPPPLPRTPLPLPPPAVPTLFHSDTPSSRSHPAAGPNRSHPPSAVHTNLPLGTTSTGRHKCQTPKNVVVVRGGGGQRPPPPPPSSSLVGHSSLVLRTIIGQLQQHSGPYASLAGGGSRSEEEGGERFHEGDRAYDGAREDFSVIEFPRENLRFLEKAGEGQFGEVQLCETFGIDHFLDDSWTVTSSASAARSALVAVKMLRKNANEQTRSDFVKEVRLMSRLRDDNIVRLIGVCTLNEPLCVIIEYMKYGDLHQFLRRHAPLNANDDDDTLRRTAADPITLSYGSLIFMATQIASGMKFMEALSLVHRDLATRNCLVGDNCVVKIADFGMSRSLYSVDYYTVQGRATLPIRWMAWESVILGKFSTKSDVWSFGVTMWEILTFALEQPLHDLTNEQVIANLDRLYCASGAPTDADAAVLAPPSPVCPPRPGICPPEIYDLMRECWRRDEASRPAFREIHMFLHRKNIGYSSATCCLGNRSCRSSSDATKPNDAPSAAAAAAAAGANDGVVVIV